ncbi:hypothetical protein HDU97_003672 [Phlyctochytrium planicorne]|nr:hypothetical protein HDU97_003672 [Phlyctochytrium planicorne]
MKFSSVFFASFAVVAVGVQAAPVAIVDSSLNVAATVPLAITENVPVAVVGPQDSSQQLVNLSKRSWKDKFKKFLKKALKTVARVATKLNPVTNVISSVAES